MISIKLPSTAVSQQIDNSHSVFSPTRLSPVYPTFTLTDTTSTVPDDEQPMSAHHLANPPFVAMHSSLKAQIVSDAQTLRRFKPLQIVISQNRHTANNKKSIAQNAIHKHPNAIPSFQVTIHCDGVFSSDHPHVATPACSPRHPVDHDKTPMQTPRTARPLKRNMEKLVS